MKGVACDIVISAFEVASPSSRFYRTPWGELAPHNIPKTGDSYSDNSD